MPERRVQRQYRLRGCGGQQLKRVARYQRVYGDRRSLKMTMLYRCMTHETLFTTLSDQDLIVQAHRLAANERTATATLIACLAELDARRLHLGMGYSSLHDYCAKALHLTDYAGYARIEAARVARRFPLLLDLLRDGSINLTSITLLGRHLTERNHERVLRDAMHKSKREIEVLVAALRPRPDVPPIIRKLPAVKPATGSSAPLSRPRADGAAAPSGADVRLVRVGRGGGGAPGPLD